jgi:hypothetical protein
MKAKSSKNPANLSDQKWQHKLHAEVAKCFGVLAGENARRSETVRHAIRKRLSERRGA